MPFHNWWKRAVALFRWLRYDAPLVKLWAVAVVLIALMFGVVGIVTPKSGIIGTALVLILPIAALTSCWCAAIATIFRGMDVLNVWLEQDGIAQWLVRGVFMTAVLGTSGYFIWQDRHTPDGRTIFFMLAALLGLSFIVTLLTIVGALIRARRNITPSP